MTKKILIGEVIFFVIAVGIAGYLLFFRQPATPATTSGQGSNSTGYQPFPIVSGGGQTVSPGQNASGRPPTDRPVTQGIGGNPRTPESDRKDGEERKRLEGLGRRSQNRQGAKLAAQPGGFGHDSVCTLQCSSTAPGRLNIGKNVQCQLCLGQSKPNVKKFL